MRVLLYIAPFRSASLAYARLAGCCCELDCLQAEVINPDPSKLRFVWILRAYYVAEPHLTFQDAARRGMRLVELPALPAAGEAAA